ncbi:proteophosphoglycan ppg4 [Rhodotorula toruloides]|uniref:Proteophosphoglycan ppg4 n=1 Tax=Rhodotorula toruloides TaxID=5286 RepID=A0A511KPI6_RHOTO|nr:proteophosphoglycan ppg4 [Rhodotorula toruloides]
MGDQLLSILRGTAPPPPAPSTQGPPSTASKSVYATAPPTPAQPGQSRQPNPLKHLLRTFSHPHPSSQTSTASQPSAPPVPPQLQHRQTDQGTMGGITGVQGAGQARAGDSASLLSLFHGTRSPPAAALAPAQSAAQVEGSSQGALRSPTSPRVGNAQDLLGLLMGGSAGQATPQDEASAEERGRAQSSTGGEQAGVANLRTQPGDASTAPQPAAPASSTGQTPNFAFVSPFDILDKTRHAEQSQPAPLGPLSPGTSAPHPVLPPHSSIPQHLRPTTSSRPTTSESDASETSATSPLASSSANGIARPITTRYLSIAHLPPDSPFAAPSWAPIGLRLPRSDIPPPDEPEAQQHLSIPLVEPHRESLVSPKPEITPVALFNVPLPAEHDDDGLLRRSRRTAGIWTGGIAYATAGGKGRVRVIDRESGAKVLLKGSKKEKEIVDLAISPKAMDGGERLVATVGKEGRLSVWKVPDSFDNEEAAEQECKRVLELFASGASSEPSDPPAPRCTLVRFAPNFPASRMLAVAKSNATVDIINLLDPHAKPVSVSRAGGTEGVSDVALTPAGSAVAVLYDSGRVVQWEADGSNEKELHRAFLSDGEKACQLVFLYPPPVPGNVAEPFGFAISSRSGTLINIFALAADEPSTVVDVLRSSDVSAASLFTQIAYHDPSQSLVASHSLRGSLFAFRLTFPSLPGGALRVDHVLEHPTPAPVLSYSIDSLVSAEPRTASAPPSANDGRNVPAGTKLRYGALVVHPGGVHHVALVAEHPCAVLANGSTSSGSSHEEEEEMDALDAAMEAGRRMSLEGSIYVSSEVEVCVDEPETDEISLSVAMPPTPPVDIEDHEKKLGEVVDENATPLAGTPPVFSPSLQAVQAAQEQRQLALPSDSLHSSDDSASGDLSNRLPAASTPVQDAGGDVGVSPTSGINVAGPVVNAAIRSMKASKVPSGSGSSRAASTAPPAEKEKREVSAKSDAEIDSVTLVKELRRIEASLPVKIGKAVQKEVEKYASHFAPSSRAPAFDSATLSTTVESAVSNALEKKMAEVVKAELGREIAEVIQSVLPVELQKQLKRPDMTLPLSASIATTIVPPIERTLASALVDSIVPTFETKLAAAVDGVVEDIRQEMVDVRKEIVQEQSGSVSVLEDEVQALREEVSTMKSMLEKMERLVLASAAHAHSPETTSPRIVHQAVQHARQPVARHVSQPFVPTGPLSPIEAQHPLRQSQPTSASFPLPPIPRAQTPPERYEELFTETMQPQLEPEFAALQHLISSAPVTRIDAVFPPPPAAPKITMAVVLSLAYRLSQVLANKDVPLDEEGRKQLLWLRKAIAACDGKQPPDLLHLIPRILTNVIDNLILRGRRLMAINDQAGAGEIRLVQQYANARLSLFAHAGADGPGVEVFRR